MNGRRIKVCYPGQQKQCMNCFNQGHIFKDCPDQLRGNWLDFVSRVYKSGLFADELFGEWLNTLGRLHPEHNRPDPSNLRQKITFNKANVPEGDLRRQIGFSSNSDLRQRVGWNPEYYQDQPGQNNWARGRSRGRATRYYENRGRGYNRGRGQRGHQNYSQRGYSNQQNWDHGDPMES